MAVPNVNTGAAAQAPTPFKSRQRLRKDRFIGAGRGVKVTNPAAGPAATARMTGPTLGMGGVPTQAKRY